MSGLVEFARYPDAALAHIVQGRLEAAGIGAVCFDTGMNIADSAAFLFPVRVMVLAEDLAAARAVLAEAMPDTEPAGPWREPELAVAAAPRKLLLWGSGLLALALGLGYVAVLWPR